MPPNTANVAEVAIVIVGFRNPEDIVACLRALSHATDQPGFDIFICENGGVDAFDRLSRELVEGADPCCAAEGAPVELRASQFFKIRQMRFRTRSSRVWVGAACENLGYAGGINAWLKPLASLRGWKGIWILNPDTEPEPGALAALVQRAEIGNKGMVGSTILDPGCGDLIRFRGGLQWQPLAARAVALGLGERVGVPHQLTAIEASMDSPSGASMYVTRSCIQQIGPMDESFFLFFEDLDWGLKAKEFGLGYASDSIVAHKRGTTTGSAKSLGALPKLSVYLEHRNAIHFVRKHFPRTLPIRIVVSLMCAIRFLGVGAPNNFLTALRGLAAGLRGETGRPVWHRDKSFDPSLRLD
ncbi:hypothetical protein XI09_05170 [Bradyrhizobium sp. CCBAU 11386]|nr:hypothetical protein [Bradyrhizobium sp. CCBAU 11386]